MNPFGITWPWWFFVSFQKRIPSQNSMSLNLFDNAKTQREMIAKLEARNRDILREIATLR